ncbi:MAG: 50S ribosome-binding GTPase [Sedimentisphaerales bacterium]|nr:50S ribosome-binding GTPase [Sedimentisphaerales bacterium]
MRASAAVMTGPGAGAIATIQLLGASARDVLQNIFQPIGGTPLEFTAGRILLGHIVDRDNVIDQVTIGCEAPDTFAIHCHGNPLIVERIMELLQRRGVALVPAGQLLARMLAEKRPHNAIAVEARVALTTVKTVEGARILAHQIEAGLCETAEDWRRCAESGDLERIVTQAKRILRDSDTARLILSGCTIVLTGPPNTGKSTLLNALAGREKALVTDVEGTTRDWVSAEIHIPPLGATVIDTAGLDADLAAAPGRDIDKAAQARAVELLERADVVLLVLDAGRDACPFDPHLVERLAGKRTIVVLNKSDLPSRLDPASLPQPLGPAIPISAKNETGIEDLIHAIHHACNVTTFNHHTPIAFTQRQRALIERLAAATCPERALVSIKGLLHGAVRG